MGAEVGDTFRSRYKDLPNPDSNLGIATQEDSTNILFQERSLDGIKLILAHRVIMDQKSSPSPRNSQRNCTSLTPKTHDQTTKSWTRSANMCRLSPSQRRTSGASGTWAYAPCPPGAKYVRLRSKISPLLAISSMFTQPPRAYTEIPLPGPYLGQRLSLFWGLGDVF